MKLVFVLSHALYLRNFESVIRALDARGHDVEIAFTAPRPDDAVLIGYLVDGCARVRVVDAPRRTGWWWAAADPIRAVRDFAHYLDPAYDDAPKLVGRAARRVPAPLRRAFAGRGAVVRSCRHAVERGLDHIERSLPSDPGVLAWLAARAADAILVSPLIDLDYQQLDVLKAARSLGLPGVHLVASWDNLTNKGRIQLRADLIVVWNEAQKAEAARLHGVPPERVAVTGAQLYDHWFDKKPRDDREGFCARVGGLDPARPIVLYVGSSPFICEDETNFVADWLSCIRADPDPLLAGVNVIVRPHPMHAAQWRHVELPDHAVVWPPAGATPLEDEHKEGFFDSLWHSAVVVGVNTSAFLEAGIVGRRTLSVRTAAFAATQDGTLHFRHIADGGLLKVAATMDEHLDHLRRAVRSDPEDLDQVRRFIGAFLRPHGLDRPATPIVVDVVEALARRGRVVPRPAPLLAPLIRALVKPVAAGYLRPRYLAALALREDRRRAPPARAHEGDRKSAMTGGKTILFLMRNLWYLRNFEAPLRALARRGHRIVVLADPTKTMPREVTEQAEALARDFPGLLSFGASHGRRDFRRAVATEIQCARDILHYHHPRYASSAMLRERATSKAPPMARLMFRTAKYADPVANAAADRRLARLDEALPPDAAILARLADARPDLVVVTPLIDLRTTQIDWVRAAHHLGIPTVLAVASWDNLTNKSRIQAMPDRVIVWNEAQKREAMELHGVDGNAIVVTGAQLYDHWFERRPSCDRAAFCARFGFDPQRPIVLYAGSSFSIARDEPVFVRRWLEALRACGHRDLAGANVLVRPHPMNQDIYADLDVNDLGPAAVHPRVGGFPVVEGARTEYFDALHHCAALVGLNTSALVEASILGKRCFTVRDPAYVGAQEGTLHFHHLTAGGILRQADDLASHFAELAAELGEPAEGRAGTEGFVRDFIRPHGLDEPATPRFVAAIEDALELRRTATRPGRQRLAGRLAFDGASVALLGLAGVHRTGEYLRYFAKNAWARTRRNLARRARGKAARLA